jgi:hypothetical protein
MRERASDGRRRPSRGRQYRTVQDCWAQIERVLSVNDLHLVSTAVVEAARDSLVIGPG